MPSRLCWGVADLLSHTSQFSWVAGKIFVDSLCFLTPKASSPGVAYSQWLYIPECRAEPSLKIPIDQVLESRSFLKKSLLHNLDPILFPQGGWDRWWVSHFSWLDSGGQKLDKWKSRNSPFPVAILKRRKARTDRSMAGCPGCLVGSLTS